ncbi:hypothetical protein C8R47DRAFT_1163099 [Mycena vitilis]|nr:hypothetical protein C8R47DRAFT_1163099 [Mycena vitilis]
MPQCHTDCEALPQTLVQLQVLDRGSPHAPDLSHLLETNESPLNSELQLVQNAIHDCHNFVESLDAQIDDLNAQIDGLHAQISNIQISLAQTVQLRDQTAENIRKHQLIMSPVRHLPTELICKIFFYAWSARALKAGPTLSPTPWYLGRICRRWRHCAIAFPLLWSTITIHCSSSVARIAAQLLRFANAPLDIYWSGAVYTAISILVCWISFFHIAAAGVACGSLDLDLSLPISISNGSNAPLATWASSNIQKSLTLILQYRTCSRTYQTFVRYSWLMASRRHLLRSHSPNLLVIEVQVPHRANSRSSVRPEIYMNACWLSNQVLRPLSTPQSPFLDLSASVCPVPRPPISCPSYCAIA